ncbi:hypothetical protein ACFQX6_52840 [Streptosporangium lutulentum]
MGDALENYAGLFFAGAIVCSVGAAGLFAWACFALVSKANPLVGTFAHRVALLYGEAFRDITKKMLVKNVGILGAGIGLVMMIQQFFTMSMQDDLTKAASPTDMNSIPQFENAVIKNLPTAESNQFEGTSGLASEIPKL